MKHAAFEGELSREALADWYRAARARTRELFALFGEDAYHDRPIPLRNPIVFYEGHLPAFSVNTLVKLAQRRPGVDARLEVLFERGIDPEDESAVPSAATGWPPRSEVLAYAEAADELVLRAIADGPLMDDDVPQLRRGEAVFTILEHELMHQETLLYILHSLPDSKKIAVGVQARLHPLAERREPADATAHVDPGTATLGADRDEHFGWDNEFDRHEVHVPGFTIDVHNVTNARFREYVEATGAAPPHFWDHSAGKLMIRGFSGLKPFEPEAPVYVTHDQASAFARWSGGRLPTEAEYHRAAFGTPEGVERSFPWGEERPDATRGAFGFTSFDPVPAGSFPAGASAWGVHDLVGNGWEWTSSAFAPFAGFEAMPSYLPYSTDFFDGAHFVLKGASPVTPVELIRRSFRNWFRPAYPYVYATFRCVRSKARPNFPLLIA